MLFSLQLIERR